MRDYFKNLYSIKLENLWMSRIQPNHQNINQEVNDLNRLLRNKEVFELKKSPEPERFTEELYQTFKDNLYPIFSSYSKQNKTTKNKNKNSPQKTKTEKKNRNRRVTPKLLLQSQYASSTHIKTKTNK